MSVSKSCFEKVVKQNQANQQTLRGGRTDDLSDHQIHKNLSRTF